MANTLLSPGLMQAATSVFEQPWMPDFATRLAIRSLVAHTSRSLEGVTASVTSGFAREMQSLPIALHADAANAQHYELPAEFFALVLGPQRKYSCCYYEDANTTLADAEEAALGLTASRAGLANGQTILELGCGWGSLTLWMARNLPDSTITAVSNSHSQKAFIEERSKALKLRNISVVTADANTFDTCQLFDRVVSIEMFEHMSNWSTLLSRILRWLKPEGRLFLHVFAHRSVPYRFDCEDPADWIGRHFFTGGIMPSEALIDRFPHYFVREATWRWSGAHYRRTAEDWLANFDRSGHEVMEIFQSCYGREAKLWHRRWRLFFLATAGLFGHADGRDWGVCHYLLRPNDGADQAANQRTNAGAAL